MNKKNAKNVNSISTNNNNNSNEEMQRKRKQKTNYGKHTHTHTDKVNRFVDCAENSFAQLLLSSVSLSRYASTDRVIFMTFSFASVWDASRHKNREREKQTRQLNYSAAGVR